MDDASLPRPASIVLDLDGVLADVFAGKALVEPDDLAAIARRCPVAVVTSCDRQLAESVLAHHGFLPFVSAVVCSEDGPGKPSGAPVLLALERVGCSGQPAWMLGDNPTDVCAANAAGVVALAVEPRGIGAEGHACRLRGAGAQRLVAGVAGLLALLG